MSFRVVLLASLGLAIGCGPTARNNGNGGSDASCNPGDSQACYDGQSGTEGTGPCKGGMQTCTAAGQWGDCEGEVVPTQEICGDNIDNNCNGMTDEDVDNDGDGWTTCQGDCCDSTECGNPAEVNPGAYDTPGDGVDNDCDGTVDNPVTACDTGLMSGSTNAMDYAKAIDLCQTTTMNDPMKRWGVIDAKFTLADGTGMPNPKAHAILAHYGTGVMPHAGSNLMLISTGNAAGEGDPNYNASLDADMGKSSGFPSDFQAANGGTLPTAPGCPTFAMNTKAGDPVMLTLTIRVPTNAQSFSLDTNFFSSEFPEWVCSNYNDFFVVLLDSMYSGANPNPMDKNLAIYTDPSGKKYPVGVNLAFGNTGLFTQCVNGDTGCQSVLGSIFGMGGMSGMISSCTGVDELAGTGMEVADQGDCNDDSKMGGATGWLTTTGNVKPGEIVTLRIAIWDTSDSNLDSLAVVDNFRWSADPSSPGTVIGRQGPRSVWATPLGRSQLSRH